MRVLVAEDDADIRDVLCAALKDEGHEVEGVREGRAALEVSRQWRPDLIVLDMMMPEMDGWTLLGELRKRRELAAVPVVVVSASRWLGRQAAALGVEAIIPKPFDLDHVLDTVAGLAERRGSGDG